MRSFAFDTPRLNCLPVTDVDSGELYNLVAQSGVGQQRSCFSNLSKFLDKVQHNGYVSIGAFLNNPDGSPSSMVGCICGVPLDRSLVLDFLIADKYRRNGFGTELMYHFLKRCQYENLISQFQVQVEKNNLPTISFLDSMNFSVYPGGNFSVTGKNGIHHFCTYRTKL